jgi:hypothetical protein
MSIFVPITISTLQLPMKMLACGNRKKAVPRHLPPNTILKKVQHGTAPSTFRMKPATYSPY